MLTQGHFSRTHNDLLKTSFFQGMARTHNVLAKVHRYLTHEINSIIAYLRRTSPGWVWAMAALLHHVCCHVPSVLSARGSACVPLAMVVTLSLVPTFQVHLNALYNVLASSAQRVYPPRM